MQAGKGELDGLLSLAEELKRERQRLLALRGVCLVFANALYLVTLVLAVRLLEAKGFQFTWLPTYAMPNEYVVLSLVLLAPCWVMVSRVLRRLLIDQRTVGRLQHEILCLISETIDTVAQKEQWSALKNMEYRIRLSRFESPRYVGALSIAPNIIEEINRRPESLYSESPQPLSEYPKQTV